MRRFPTAIIATALVLLAPVASAQDSEALTWARANTCEKIRAYVAAYPSGRFLAQARQALTTRNCPDPEAEARRRAEREAAERVRLENEAQQLRDRLAREEAARIAAERRAADEAAKRRAAESGKTATPPTAGTAAAFDLSRLHQEVRRAAEQARAAEARALTAANRAKEIAAQARASGRVRPSSGLGTLRWDSGEAAGDTFAGTFANSVRNGPGVLTYSPSNNRIAYEGDWAGDNRSGYGLTSHRDGDRYAGQFAEDTRHGFGVYRFADGQRYEGEWSRGERVGYGVMWSAAGAPSFVGIWTNGQLTTPLR